MTEPKCQACRVYISTIEGTKNKDARTHVERGLDRHLIAKHGKEDDAWEQVRKVTSIRDVIDLGRQIKKGSKP